jgi:hypothetical protein
MKKFSLPNILAIAAASFIGLCSIAAADQLNVNAQTGTTYTFLNSDCSKLVTFTNASAIAATLPQASNSTGGGAGTGNFLPPCTIKVLNQGAGTLTITPSTSTIGGNATLVLITGASATIVSDGINYQADVGAAGNIASNWVGTSNVAVTITSLGPTGSHTTIQEWMSFKDASGVVRYIPAY